MTLNGASAMKDAFLALSVRKASFIASSGYPT
jgi:hypothetical protein